MVIIPKLCWLRDISEIVFLAPADDAIFAPFARAMKIREIVAVSLPQNGS